MSILTEQEIRERIKARKTAEEYLALILEEANSMSGQAKEHFIRTLGTGLNPGLRAIGLIIIEESKIKLSTYIKKEINYTEGKLDELEESIQELLE